jgi:tetratricopeptide (TPR) repeat protein
MAWDIQLGVPLDQRIELTAANLGAYYRAKGDLLGGPPNAKGRRWYERAVEILNQGVLISKARERAFDQAQIAHGKPLAGRSGMQNLYFNLGAVYASLGLYPDALDAYLFGRNLNPDSGNPYPEIAAVDFRLGRWRDAARVLHEEILVEGAKADTVEQLLSLYQEKLSVSCARLQAGPGLNYACQPVREDLCAASSDLQQAYTEARQHVSARGMAARAREYGCRLASQ